MTSIDPEIRAAAVAALRNGKTATLVAAEFGVCLRTVTRWRAAAGIPVRPYRRFTQEEITSALRLLQDGASYAEAGRTLGRSDAAIRRRFPGYGWTKSEGVRFMNLTVRLGLDEILPSRGGSKYNSEPVYHPFVKRLTRVERERLAE